MSEQAKHTPGPWDCVDDKGDGYIHYISRVGSVRVAKTTVGLNGDEVTQANARLIAAAPDLLHALQEIMGREELYDGTYADDLQNIARDAVRKATGQD